MGSQLKIVLFANLREELECSELLLDLTEQTSIASVIDQLASEHGERWRELLTAENTRIAVNQTLISGNELLAPGDELAFFPPVTGG